MAPQSSPAPTYKHGGISHSLVLGGVWGVSSAGMCLVCGLWKQGGGGWASPMFWKF